MIILDSATKSIEVLLSGTVTTSQLEWVAAWVDIIGGPPPTSFLSGAADGVTNNTTAVTAVAAPAAATQRQLKFLTVYNADTALITVTVRYKDGLNTRRIVVVSLAPHSTLFYTDGEGFRVIDASGIILEGASGSFFMTLQLLTADPASPPDDTWWAVRTGTAPGDQIIIRARVAGVTYDIATYTI